MKLYHGSNEVVNKPRYNGSRNKTDFGKGFYLSKDENEARRWSIKGNENIAIHFKRKFLGLWWKMIKSLCLK